ncbi:MAG TPA: spondin domain-containing protein [Xenococcaceae cyanobacterium]
MTDFEVTIKIENTAPDNGVFLTPVWVGLHDGDFDAYDFLRPVSPGVERLAEDGDTTAISTEFSDSGAGGAETVITGGEDEVIAPGEVATVTLTVNGNNPANRYFNFLSMVVPSNDAFIGNFNHRDLPIFDSQGNFLGLDLLIRGDDVVDAGTEVNDELEANTAFFSQTTPNTGVTQDGIVRRHPGFRAEGRILSEDGTSENAPAAFNNADFKANGYQVARITVSTEELPLPVAEPVNLTATLNGEQEVEAGDAEATGTSVFRLNDTGDALEYSLTISGLDFGANGLVPGGAQTPETNDDVTRLHVHNAPRGENGAVVFSLFDTVAPELGNVLEIAGNQDEDLAVTLNDDGSVTLTGVWEETDLANSPLSNFVAEIRDTEEDADLNLYWNVHTTEFPDGAIRGQLVVDNEEPDPIEVVVTIENLAPTGGTFLTPFWVGFHNGGFDSYERGSAITPGLERLVEDGDTAAFSQEFLASGNGLVDGTISGAAGREGVIDPGETASATFTLDRNAATSSFFSYASMVVPSNDAFIANGDPLLRPLFDEAGDFIGADFIVAGDQVLDGGTEVNDELAESTAFFSQTTPNTGVTQNGVVQAHPGFIEGGRILSEDGTSENAPAAFNNADFTAEDYQVARITVSLVEAEPLLDTPFVRFQNSGVPGTYLYATGEEAENIRNNFPGFVEEGVAFNAAIEPDDDLIALTRLQSVAVPGTYLFVGEQELTEIRNSSDFADDFIEEGTAFYVYGVGANQETAFSRFQNSGVPGTYLYATGEEADNIRTSFPNFVDEGIAFEAAT